MQKCNNKLLPWEEKTKNSRSLAGDKALDDLVFCSDFRCEGAGALRAEGRVGGIGNRVKTVAPFRGSLSRIHMAFHFKFAYRVHYYISDVLTLH